MDAIVLQIQWEYCFTVSTNSLCQYLWNCGIQFKCIGLYTSWSIGFEICWLHFPKFEEILSNAKDKQSGREAPEVYCVRAPSWIMSCFLFLHKADKLWHSFQVCGDDNCSKWEQSNQTQRELFFIGPKIIKLNNYCFIGPKTIKYIIFPEYSWPTLPFITSYLFPLW